MRTAMEMLTSTSHLGFAVREDRERPRGVLMHRTGPAGYAHVIAGGRAFVLSSFMRRYERSLSLWSRIKRLFRWPS